MPASPSRSARPAPGGSARPGGAPADLAEVWAVITGMYEGYTAGDRDRIDSFLDPEATIWDSATPELLCGRTELDRVRDGRPTADGTPTETGLMAYDQVVDVFGDLAVARYWLRVHFRTNPRHWPETPRSCTAPAPTATGSSYTCTRTSRALRSRGEIPDTQKPQATDLGLQRERVTRIELALSAWEADVLPLNYTRV